MSTVIDPDVKDLRLAVAQLAGQVDQLSKAQNAAGRQSIYTALAISVPIALALLFGSYSQTSALRAEMNARFDAVDARLKAVDQRFDALEKRIDQSEKNLLARFDDLRQVVVSRGK